MSPDVIYEVASSINSRDSWTCGDFDSLKNDAQLEEMPERSNLRIIALFLAFQSSVKGESNCELSSALIVTNLWSQ